jgi:ubiquinone/menaquinone biosynthesis C-methylase UbiE
MNEENLNFKAFSSQGAIEFYRDYSGLQRAERYVFDKFVLQGASVLDIGVGGGRTTPYLMSKASHYVGIDYVPSMVAVCTAKFPGTTFYCADATNLSQFEDANFNVVVFSFNGIDCIASRQDRLQSLREIFRVLTPGGTFIFSSHNSKMLVHVPASVLEDLRSPRIVGRLARAAYNSFPYSRRLLSSGAFFSGCGYYCDPLHGGFKCYSSTPELIKTDVCSVGFDLLDVVHDHHPRSMPRYCIPWYYYVCAKPSASLAQDDG